jgi:hypothetical protein
MDTFRNKTNIAMKNTGPRKDFLLPLQKSNFSKLFKKGVLTMRQKHATYPVLGYKSLTLESSC